MGSRTLRSLLGIGAVLASLVMPLAAGSAAASAAPGSSCSTSTGVLVVVDLRHFGGSLTRGCDTSPSTGYNALHEAGYTTEGTQHDGSSFVCRIDGYPTPTQDHCVMTPPASAYWSYWHANAGQTSWSYSTLGAQSYHPKVGSIDAWVFGSTDVAGTSGGPNFTPAEARGQSSGGSGSGGSGSGGSGSGGSGSGGSRTGATSRSGSHPTAATHAPAATSAGQGASSRGSSPVSASTPRTPASGSTTASRSSAALSAAAASRTAQAATDAAPSFADASSVAKKSSTSSGSALPVILGVALVLLLGAGGGWGVLRRRRADAAEH